MSRVIYLVHIKIIKEFHIWRIHSVSNSRTLSRTRVWEFKFDGCWKPRGMQWLVPFSRLCWDILRHLETMASLFATSGPTRTSPLEIRSTKPGTKCTKGKKTVCKSCKSLAKKWICKRTMKTVSLSSAVAAAQFSVHSFTVANLLSTH